MSKFVRPDVVIGEAVPEIEPRVDGDVLAMVEMLTRWGLVFLPVYVLVSIVFLFFSLSVFALYGFILVGVLVWSVPFYRARKVLKAYSKEQWSVPLGVEIKHRLVLGTAGFSLTLPMMMSNGIIWVLGVMGGYLLILGCACVALKWRAREPGQISCVGCSYSLVGLVLCCECPECGRYLYGVSETTDRPRVFSAWFGWIGSGMVVLGLALLFGVFFRPGLMYERLPKSVLLELAVTDDAAFSEVILLPMDGDEREGLIDRVIEANKNNGAWSRYSYEHTDWLEQRYLDGSMNDEQVAKMLEPYDAEDLIVIDAVERGRVGEPIEIDLLGQNIRGPIGPGFFFEGYEVDQAGLLHSGSVYARSLYRITKRGRKLDDHYDVERGRPEFVVTPTEPGEIVIRARMVLVMIRGRLRTTAIDWEQPIEEAFGVPVAWYRVIDLEHRVVVEP